MKNVIWVCVLVCVHECWSLQTANSPNRHTHSFSPKCLNCHTLQLFYSNSTIVEVNCTNTGLPYCDPSTNSCAANPPPHCQPPDNFTCVSDGYFPDPLDCRSFHLCVDNKATRYTCEPTVPSSYYYHVILHRCTYTASCGYSCSGRSGVKVAHPDDGNLFAYCYNGTVLVQDRCPGNYDLNETSQACEAVCTGQGLMVDVFNCTRYYKCSYQNYGYYKSHEKCPDGQSFNPITMLCEDSQSACHVEEPNDDFTKFITTETSLV